jgi:hypothetical protein
LRIESAISGEIIDRGDSISEDRENRDTSLPRMGEDLADVDWLAIACAASLLHRLMREEWEEMDALELWIVGSGRTALISVAEII